MRNLSSGRDVEIPTTGGVLDGRNPLGTGDPSDFRILLNTETNELRGRARMAGWSAARSDTPSNEDLHDQLLDASIRIRSTKLIDDAVITESGEITFRMLDSSAVSQSAYGGKFTIQTFDGIEYGPFDPSTITDEEVKATNIGTKTGTVFSYSLVTMLKSDDPEDHDTYAIPTQREAVTLMEEAVSSAGIHYQIKATKSRIYVGTGQGRNQRLIADGLGGALVEGDSPWPNSQITMDQSGDFALFTNGIDPVLIWPLGGPVVSSGLFADKLWAAQPVADLLGLDITRAGVVGSSNGWSFIADVTVGGTRYPNRVYWSDFGNPKVWAPGGESLAGFDELAPGEVVLKIAELGKTTRLYTDKSVYLGEYLGFDSNGIHLGWRFVKLKFSGNLSIAFKNSFINLGVAHVWLTNDSIAVQEEYDSSPRLYDWLHRWSGYIFKGLDGSLLGGLPDSYPFSGFEKINKSKCHQIAAGFDDVTGNCWISWPTVSADTSDFEGVRRMTGVFNLRHNRTTLVNKSFSAFGTGGKSAFKTIRDFMVEEGVCDITELLAAEDFIQQKEALPLNVATTPNIPPTCLWNETENPLLPMSESSLAAQTCDIRLALDCKECIEPTQFLMATVDDFSVKSFDESLRLREQYDLASDTTWSPDASGGFPNVLTGSYQEVGYPTLIQSEATKYDSNVEKLITRMAVEYDAEAQDEPGTIHAQIGVSNSPRCMDWFNSRPVVMDCLRTVVDSAPMSPDGCPPPAGPGTDDPAPDPNPEDTAPTAEFTWDPTTGTPGAQIDFTNTSTGGPFSVIVWDFGDSSLETGVDSLEHSYTEPGTYDVTLTVTDGDGDIDSITHQVVIEDPYVDNPPEPPDINNLNTWLRADAGVCTDVAGSIFASDGDRVRNWRDQSGQGLNVIQSVSGNPPNHNRPTYHTGIQNGLPVIRSNEPGEYLFSSTGLAQPQVISLVCKWDASVDSSDSIVVTNEGGGGGFSIRRDASGAFVVRDDDSAHVISGGTLDVDTFYVLSVVFNGASSKIRINGVDIASGDLGTENLAAFIPGGGLAPTGFTGDMCEFTRYSGVLADYQIAGIEQYLATKWGVTL